MAVVLVEGEDQLPALVGQYNPVVERSKGSSLIMDARGGSVVLGVILVGAITVWF